MSTASFVKENFEIVRLAEGDIRCKSDHFADFKNLILSNHCMYPEIEYWLAEKVLPGIRQEERVAFVGYLDQKPAVSAVVKKGDDAKFCHLRIHEDLQDSNLGEVFFSLMSLEIRDLAKNIHFTLPESLWKTKGPFFRSFGFHSATMAESQYRFWENELACSTPFSTVWKSVLQKMPKLSHLYAFGDFAPDNQILMSVKPEFAERIMSRKKTVELRRRFSTRWINHRINIYASSPVMSLLGEARIAGVVRNKPEIIWERFHNEIGCSRTEFDEYASGANELFAIELDDVKQYRSRIPLMQMSHLLNEELTPPQSYMTLENGKPWAKAISLAAYIHGCLKSTVSLAMDIASFSEKVSDSSAPGASAPRMTQQNLI